LIKLISTVDWLVLNSQTLQNQTNHPLQPGFHSLAEVYMYVSFTFMITVQF